MVEANRALEVFKALRLPDVPGTPTLAEAGGAWFFAIVLALFGSYIDGERFIRELFLLVPKKNAKTTYGAALILTAALLSRRPRAEFLFIGPTQAIADTGFQQAVGMVLADPFLKKRIKIQEHQKRLTLLETGVKLMIKTFDEHILTGVKPSGGTLIDEYHLLGELLKAAPVLRQLRGGMLPFPESFLVGISTQSEKPPAGEFLEQLKKARAVRDGRIKAPLLAVLYEFAEEMLRNDGWRDRRHWAGINPNVGRSLTVDRLWEDYQEAVAKGDSALRGWASQHLNVQIGMALATDAWVGAKHWAKNADVELVELDALLERCEVATIGLDGGGLDDLFGLCVNGRERETRKRLVWIRAFAFRSAVEEAAQGVLEQRKAIASRLLDFEKEGTLIFYEKPGDDITMIVEIVKKVRDAGLLPEKDAIGVDPSGIPELVDALVKADFSLSTDEEVGEVSGVRQGWQLIDVIKTVERLLAAGTMKHGGTALMAWVLGNAKVEQRSNAVLITKQASGTGKIDPLMALLNAEKLMSKNPPAAGNSVYEERGLLTIA